MRAAFAAVFVVVLAVVISSVAQASVVRAADATFGPDASRIGFAEVPIGTTNPIYTPGPTQSSRTAVSFGGFFLGQSMTSPDGCSQRVSCLSGSPSAGLALDADAPPVVTVKVRDSQNNPVLSGSPFFAGSISVLFSLDQAGVGVSAGFANALGADRLTAFDRDGNVLASIVNDALGFSFLALASDDLSNQIAGVQLTGTGLSAGFAAENLLFGEGDQRVADNGPPNPMLSVPEPSNLVLFVLALVGIALATRRRHLRG